MCTPMPACIALSPLPAMVARPSTKSVGAVGSCRGSQRSCAGGAASRRLVARGRVHQVGSRSSPERVVIVIIVVVRPALVVVGIDVAATSRTAVVFFVLIVILVDRRRGLRRMANQPTRRCRQPREKKAYRSAEEVHHGAHSLELHRASAARRPLL